MADFVPRVEVKSKKKKGKWKVFHATIDTGCHSGDWVSLQVIDKLGYTGELLPLTASETNGSVTAGGMELSARGAVNLTWHAIPGEDLPNSTRSFKRRFLVAAVQDPPFEMLIGLRSICADRILFAPTLMVSKRKNILCLPREAPSKKQIRTFQFFSTGMLRAVALTPTFQATSETFEERKRIADEEKAAELLADELQKQAEKERRHPKPSKLTKRTDTPMGSRTSSLTSLQSESSGRTTPVQAPVKPGSNKITPVVPKEFTDGNVRLKKRSTAPVQAKA